MKIEEVAYPGLYKTMRLLSTDRICAQALEFYFWGRFLTERKFEFIPRCSWCNSVNVTIINRRQVPNLYQCNRCRRKFNILTGTPLARTRGIQKWFIAWWFRDSLTRRWREAGLRSKREAVRIEIGLKQCNSLYGTDFFRQVRIKHARRVRKTDTEVLREFNATGKIPEGVIILRGDKA
jgi:transposase-like protein